VLRGKLLRDSGTYLAGSAAPRVLGVFLLPVWTKYLSPYEFGVISTTMAASAFAGTFFGFGMTGVVNRFYFDYEPDRPGYRRFFTSNVAVFLALAALVCVFALQAGRPAWNWATSGQIPFAPFALLALGIYVTGALWKTVVAAMRAERRSGEVVALETGVQLLAIAAGLYLVVARGGGAPGKLAGELAASGVGALAALVLVARRYGALDWSWADVAKGFAFGLPLVPHLAAHWGLSLSGRMLVTKYSTVEQAGFFGVAGFVGMTITMAQQSVNSAWSPKYFGLMRDDTAGADRDARAYFAVWIAGSGLACVAASVFARELVTFLADARYFEAWKLVFPVALGAFVYGLYFPAINQLVFFKRKRSIPVLTVAAALLQVGAGIILVQRMGAAGAAYSLLLAYGLLAVLSHLVARRDHRAGYPAFRVACGVALVASAGIGGRIDTGSLAADLAAKSAVLILFASGAALVLVWPYRRVLGLGS
jgi:O-antigen/teichoic acid export membrane protein